jgi:hypothetical protein
MSSKEPSHGSNDNDKHSPEQHGVRTPALRGPKIAATPFGDLLG